MQALIDFDGWRRWKDFAAQSDTTEGTSKLSTSYSAIAPKGRTNSALSPTSANHGPNGRIGSAATNGVSPPKAREDEKKNKRRSTGMIPPPLPEEESGNSTPDALSFNS
jgi:osomolarity two-component system response regulator SSK1